MALPSTYRLQAHLLIAYGTIAAALFLYR